MSKLDENLLLTVNGRIKMAQLESCIRQGTDTNDFQVNEILNDPEIQDFISQPEIYGPEMNRLGYSPLHCAAQWGRPEFVLELLKFGANINSIEVSANGRNKLTALHFAVQYRKPEVIKVLLESGANPDMKGRCRNQAMRFQDLTPLEWAKRKNFHECAKIFEDFQKNSGAENPVGPRKIAKLEAATKFVPNLTEKRDQIDHLSDVEIICKRHGDETIFRCHQFVLSICSPVFLKMFKTKESEQFKTGKIIVKDIPVHVMKQFLDFLYQDELENVPLDDVEELLKIGERYKVDGLKIACEVELIKMLNLSNCVFMLHLAKKCGGDQLEVKALDMVKSNLSIATESKDFVLLMQDFPDALLRK